MTSLSTTEVNLSNSNITKLYHMHLMYDITTLDLSHNQLRNLSSLNSLQKLETLNASDNLITCIKGVRNMPSLVFLNLTNNSKFRTLIWSWIDRSNAASVVTASHLGLSWPYRLHVIVLYCHSVAFLL